MVIATWTVCIHTTGHNIKTFSKAFNMGSSNSCNINESKSKSGGSLKESQCSNCNNNMTSNIQDNSNRSSNYGQPGYGLP